MVDNEMLEAIGQLLAEQSRQMADRMDSRLAPIQADLADVRQRMTKMEIHQENVTDKNIQIIIEGQQGTNEKFRKLDKMAEDVEEIKVKVSALEETSKSQASQIKELRIAK